MTCAYCTLNPGTIPLHFYGELKMICAVCDRDRPWVQKPVERVEPPVSPFSRQALEDAGITSRSYP